MSTPDPAWVQITIGVVSSVITGSILGAVNYAALKVWMARREEREEQNEADIADHETRIRVLERGPLDYPAHR